MRLTGTNSDKAATIIDKFNADQKNRKDGKKVNLIVVKDFDSAATEVVRQASLIWNKEIIKLLDHL